MSTDAPREIDVRAALDELLGWPGISRSPKLADLLRYVVDRSLQGEAASIKAYSIAVDVFGRSASFDPQADPIVRVQARRLRTLIEQFYASGLGRSAVQIRLPLGRYVPEFVRGAVTPWDAETLAAPAAQTGASPTGWSRFKGIYPQLFVVGLGFTVIGVALTIGLLRWLGAAPPSVGDVPDLPTVVVEQFDNLTGDAAFEPVAAGLKRNINDGLGRFEDLAVGSGPKAFHLRGSLQQTGAQLSIKAILSSAGGSGTAWTTTILAPSTEAEDAALAAATTSLLAQLADANGPLHAAGRAWLKQRAGTALSNPTNYVCRLAYMAWRDHRELDEADAAADCFGNLLKTGDDALATSALAGIDAWRIAYRRRPGDDLGPRLAPLATQALQAVSRAPTSSFAFEQQGLVLARQGSPDAAMGALDKAVALNPANVDAIMAGAMLRFAGGDFAGGSALAERALSLLPSGPPWYYTVRALNALRERRFFDAAEAGLAMSAGDLELGPAIVVAAAPIIGRKDLIDRYRPAILGDVLLQQVGILPRLGMMVRQPAIVASLREGLTLAGLPIAALNGPFNPDGTARN